MCWQTDIINFLSLFLWLCLLHFPFLYFLFWRHALNTFGFTKTLLYSLHGVVLLTWCHVLPIISIALEKIFPSRSKIWTKKLCDSWQSSCTIAGKYILWKETLHISSHQRALLCLFICLRIKQVQPEPKAQALVGIPSHFLLKGVRLQVEPQVKRINEAQTLHLLGESPF